MAIEIEHKYLVIQEIWAAVTPERSTAVQQAYLLNEPEKTIRVRLIGEEGYLTIKGKTEGASRTEYEYGIPYEDARDLIARFGQSRIEKVRHYVQIGGKTWEVDEFGGDNAGLMVAEIELEDESEAYTLPDWAGEQVTHDARYLNANLIKHPYSRWVRT